MIRILYREKEAVLKKEVIMIRRKERTGSQIFLGWLLIKEMNFGWLRKEKAAHLPFIPSRSTARNKKN
jgi:hypothetical protein